jgi:hypothetical protein
VGARLRAFGYDYSLHRMEEMLIPSGLGLGHHRLPSNTVIEWA